MVAVAARHPQVNRGDRVVTSLAWHSGWWPRGDGVTAQGVGARGGGIALFLSWKVLYLRTAELRLIQERWLWQLCTSLLWSAVPEPACELPFPPCGGLGRKPAQRGYACGETHRRGWSPPPPPALSAALLTWGGHLRTSCPPHLLASLAADLCVPFTRRGRSGRSASVQTVTTGAAARCALTLWCRRDAWSDARAA